ncbi:hypothetical protein [Nocardiopsis sp. CC223A]|uniref:hypothetical protein n=1 Tax=Nocardiopsis sp. CC223A TaxID=3044051 RepID=UPI00278BF84F|nr:hypothetical protein [Nocardiopsis sp. CC223A]
MKEIPTSPNEYLEFSDEILTPEINFIAYRKIYVLETWVRRLCLAAWMAEFGNEWVDQIDSNLRSKLETRAKRNAKRVYLGAESSSDIIWETTHHELISLISDRTVEKTVRELTGHESAFLGGKLDEVREIRNLLAHNRAISERTYTILIGLLASLEEAIDCFRFDLLYKNGEILGFSHPEDNQTIPLESELASIVENAWQQHGGGRFQAFVERGAKHYKYVCLPVDRNGSFPNTRSLIENFSEYIDFITAFCLNKSGDEFFIVTPKCITGTTQMEICRKFSSNFSAWGNVMFENQHPRYACSPKIWFYENRKPGHLNLR